MVAHRHRLGAEHVHHRQLHLAVPGGVEQAALKLIAGIHQQHAAPRRLRRRPLGEQGRRQMRHATQAIRLCPRPADQRAAIHRLVARVKIVHVQDRQPMRGVATGQPGHRQCGECAEKQPPVQSHNPSRSARSQAGHARTAGRKQASATAWLLHFALSCPIFIYQDRQGPLFRIMPCSSRPKARPTPPP